MKKLSRLLTTGLSLLVFGAFAMQAQETISGSVTDSQREAVPGATVVFKGTTVGTITDIDGNYTLRNTTDSETLVFSFIGLKTQEINLAGRTTINVVMEPSTIGLDEVIAVGYGTSRKADLTGSVTTVSTEGFDKVPATNPLQAIQGRAAGINITSGSGLPGESAEVLIRGKQSINGTNAPVFVVDGVITNNIDNLNPNNIESISVLKDASAAAIYGARAANGVVLVTTKRGSVGADPRVTFNTYFGVQTESNLKTEFLNSDEFLELWTESHENAGLDIKWGASLPLYDGVDTNWKDLMIQTGVIQNYDLSVSGGSEKSNYFISASHLDQKGMIIETAYSKSTFTLNTDHEINNWFKFGNSLNLYTYTKKGDKKPYNYALIKTPITRAYEDDGDYGIIRDDRLEHKHQNTVWMAKETEHKTVGKGMQGNIFFTVNLLKGLEFTTRGSLDYTNAYKTDFEPGVSPHYGWEGSTINSVEKESKETVHWISDFLLNYEKTINADHSVKGLLGYSWEDSSTEHLMGSRTGTPSNDLRYLAAGDPRDQINDNGFKDWSFVSIFGRANYSYKSKYLASASVRRDGTSRLPKATRFGVFPSASVAWRLSEESFMSNASFIDDLKLRASVGVVGNVLSLDEYATSASLTGRRAVLSQASALGYTLTDATNENLVWEETKKTNIGADITAFNSKVYANFDYFIENTYDLLFEAPIANSNGLSVSPFINAGQVRNNGFELLLGYRTQKGDWSYDASINLSHVKNEMVDLEGRDLSTDGLVEGYPVNSFYGYKSNGIIYDAADLEIYKTGSFTKKKVGDIALLDIDGYDALGKLTGTPDGKVDAADRTIIGNPYPDFTYGAFGTIGYKNWSFQLQLQGAQGFDMYYGNDDAYDLIFLMSSWARNEDARVLNRYHPTKNPNGTWPRLSKDESGKNLTKSDFWLADVSYLKINNVNLNYNLPKNLLSKVGMYSLGLYVSVQNVYTFTGYDGPEVDTSADPLTGIPQPRTYTIGLKASF